MKSCLVACALLLSPAFPETGHPDPAAFPATPATDTARVESPAPQARREWVPAPVFTPDRGPARFVANDRIVLEIPLH